MTPLASRSSFLARIRNDLQRSQNAAPIVADDEETVEHREADRGNREEIYRGYDLPMIAKKGEPTRGPDLGSEASVSSSGKWFFRKCHEKFSIDVGSSPGRVLGHLVTANEIVFRTEFFNRLSCLWARASESEN